MLSKQIIERLESFLNAVSFLMPESERSHRRIKCTGTIPPDQGLSRRNPIQRAVDR